ncbi:MAG: GerMN domain-containing protein [Acidimicrobiales bacterium]
MNQPRAIPGSTRRSRLLGALLAAVALVVLAAGCGIPTEANARPIDRNALPQTLIDQTTTTTAPSNLGGLNRSAKLFLVSSKGGSEGLSPMDVDIVNVTDTAEFPQRVIEQLIAQQPKENGSGSDLTNAIPPNSEVLNASLNDGVLDLDLSNLDAVELSRQRLAAAQIVYTATAIAGIDGVRFSIDGQPAAVPLDDHASDVNQVITRGDYPSLLNY